MENLNSTLIPGWVIAFVMLYTALIWLLSIKSKVRMDSRIIAGTLIIQGLLYEVIFQILNPGVEIRSLFSKLMVLMLCLSQALPLTISCIRSVKRGD